MQHAPAFTEAEYLALEAASDTKHEFVGGVIVYDKVNLREAGEA